MDLETVENLGFMYADAVGGNGNASITLAYEITIGTALKRDDALATQWFLLAASQGHPDAYVHMGHRYYRGVGIEQNDAAAAYWFGRGASAGNRMAMTALGGLYAAGRGVPQDWAVAVAWWRKAAAWRFVGDAYACGLGVPESMEEAVVAYTKAADVGDSQSATQLGHIHSGSCVPSPDLDVASTWYEKAAERGYPEAQVGLSELLLRAGPNYLPSRAYFWAKLAELRLPPGTLRTRARNRAAQAARRLSPMETASTDVMIGAILASSSEPMNK
jgi:uncharacterized protein